MVVRVKTPSGWVTVAPGETVGGVTVPGPSYEFGTITPEIISYVDGKPVTIERSRRISGGPSRSSSEALALLKEAEIKEAERQAVLKETERQIVLKQQAEAFTSYQARRIQPTEKLTPLERYKVLEKSASEKLYGFFDFSERQHELQRQRVLESGKFIQKKAEDIKKSYNVLGFPILGTVAGGGLSIFGKTGTLISGFTGTLAKETLDKPITTPGKYVALGVAGYGVGLGLAGVSALFGTTGATAATGYFAGGLGKLVVPTLKLGVGALGATFITKKGLEVAAAPTAFEQGGIIGTTALEIGAIGGGLIGGKQRAIKIGDWWRTRGRTEIPAKDIIIKDVLTGKTRFVESKSYGYKGRPGKAKQMFDIKVFRKKPYAYHVTPEQYWKGETFTTIRGTSQFPGLYTAPSPSPYFGGVGSTTYKIKLFGKDVKIGKPAVAQIYTKFTTKAGTTTTRAFVTGVKPEIEAVIPVGKTFIKTGGTKFFTLAGKRFPIDIFRAIGVVSKKTGAVRIGGSGISSLIHIPSYPLYSPTSIGISGALSFAPVSYIPSVIPSSKPPSIISYLSPPPSQPSYIPPSYIPSGSSYVPSGLPPSVPPSSLPPYIPPSYVPSVLPPSLPPYVPPPYVPPTSPPSLIVFPSSRITKKGKGKSWIPQVRSKGKWLTVGKRMDEISALSRASKGADLSTSRRIRILPSNKPAQITGIRGWRMRQHKFRPYKIKRKRKIPLRNEYIEKTSYAIDTPTEVKGLSIAKLSKNMRWGLPTPQSKKKQKTISKKKKSGQWLV